MFFFPFFSEGMGIVAQGSRLGMDRSGMYIYLWLWDFSVVQCRSRLQNQQIANLQFLPQA